MPGAQTKEMVLAPQPEIGYNPTQSHDPETQANPTHKDGTKNVASQPIIQLSSLSKVFRLGFFRRRVNAVDGLSLEVEPGEIFGFLGPNGAGKTTTIKMLMGLIHPSSGEARLFGLDAANVKAKSRVGFLPEHPYFYEYLTGFEFLDFYARLFGLPRAKRTVRVERLLEQVGLSHAHDIHLRKYSKGMIQRLGIAQALLNDPDLVVLDEPMSGLDPIGRKDVRDIIFRLKEHGKTVFLSSHILQDVEMICDRVAIIHKGRLRKLGPLSELLQQQTSHEVELTVSQIPPSLREQLHAMALRVLKSDEKLSFVLPEHQLDETLRLVLQHNSTIESVIRPKETLETLFVQQVFDARTTDLEPTPSEKEKAEKDEEKNAKDEDEGKHAKNKGEEKSAKDQDEDDSQEQEVSAADTETSQSEGAAP